MNQFTKHVALFLFLVHNAAHAITIKEKWERDPSVGTNGVIFTDPSVNNLDLILRTGTQVRAYFMQSAGVGAALSADNGITFDDEGIRVEGGGHFTALKLENGSIRIYYVDNATGDLLSALSQDGFTFEKEDGVRLPASTVGVIHPSAILGPDGVYRIYFDKKVPGQLDFGKQILSAQSTDGLTFTKDKGVRIKKVMKNLPEGLDLIFSPFISYDAINSVYKMYFTVEHNQTPNKSGVYLALSTDGKKFVVQKGPVLRRDKSVSAKAGSAGQGGNPQDSFVLTDSDGSQRMYVWETDVGYRSALPTVRNVKQ